MIPLSEKKKLVSELTQRLEAEYETLAAAQRASVEGATHEEAKPENDKDTRALELSYLARGQAERVVTLQTDLGKMRQFVVRAFDEEDRVALGALIQVEDEEEHSQLYLLSPAGAGERLSSSLGQVKVVTPRSPLGVSLSRCQVGDDIEVQSPTGKRTLVIARLC